MRKRQKFDASTGSETGIDDGAEPAADRVSSPTVASESESEDDASPERAADGDANSVPFASPGNFASAPVKDRTPAWGADDLAAARTVDDIESSTGAVETAPETRPAALGSAAVLERLEALSPAPEPTNTFVQIALDTGDEEVTVVETIGDARAAEGDGDPAQTEVDETEVDETEVDETEVDQTEVDQTEVDQTEVDEPEVDETGATAGADSTDQGVQQQFPGIKSSEATNTFQGLAPQPSTSEPKDSDEDAGATGDDTSNDTGDPPDGSAPDAGDVEDSDPSGWLANARELAFLAAASDAESATADGERPTEDGASSDRQAEGDAADPWGTARDGASTNAGSGLGAAGTSQPSAPAGTGRQETTVDTRAHNDDGSRGGDRMQTAGEMTEITDADSSATPARGGTLDRHHEGFDEFDEHDLPRHEAFDGVSGGQPLKGGHRWYRRQIRNYGPLFGLVPMAAFGLLAWALQQFSDNRTLSAISVGLGAIAAPFLLVAGLPFGSLESYRIAIIASIAIWLLIGFWASRRALSRAMPTWRNFFTELAWLTTAVAVGVVVAYSIALYIIG